MVLDDDGDAIFGLLGFRVSTTKERVECGKRWAPPVLLARALLILRYIASCHPDLHSIVNEAYGTGWMATRWIPGGVGLYIAFAVMAPRIHAVAKRRGYFTMSQVLFDRFSGPSSCHWIVSAGPCGVGLGRSPGRLIPHQSGPSLRGSFLRNQGAACPPCAHLSDLCPLSLAPPAATRPQIPHIIALLAFFCLQLPVFTYLITQFQSLGREVRTFTAGDISATTAICVAASVLLICDLLGGMRAVAFTGGSLTWCDSHEILAPARIFQPNQPSQMCCEGLRHWDSVLCH